MTAATADEIRNGVQGWDLADFEWSETTGRGRFVYRRGPERRIIVRQQPTRPDHEGWQEPN